MLFRSHLRSGVSVLGLARSDNGVTGWRVDPQPFLKPATSDDAFAAHLDPAEIIAMEAGGVEDARINPIDGTFAITYSGYAAEVRNRVRVLLAVSDDFTDGHPARAGLAARHAQRGALPGADRRPVRRPVPPQ